MRIIPVCDSIDTEEIRPADTSAVTMKDPFLTFLDIFASS
jgi:hypothetical protein